MTARRAVTGLLALQTVVAVGLLAFGLVIVVTTLTQERGAGGFADLARVLGWVVTGVGLVLGVMLTAALRAWQRGEEPKARTTVVVVELVLLAATAYLSIVPTRPWMWPIGITALLVIGLVGRARPVEA